MQKNKYELVEIFCEKVETLVHVRVITNES